MKKSYILLAILIVLIIIAVVYFSSPRSSSVVNKPVTPTPLISNPPPRSIPITQGSQKIPQQGVVKFDYSGPPLALPPTLPMYTTKYDTAIIAKVTALSVTWGFTARLSQPVPYVYDWIQPDKHLSYNDKSKSISFAFFEDSPNLSRSPSLTQSEIFTFLKDRGFLSEDVALVQGTTTDLSDAEGGEENSVGHSATSFSATIKSVGAPVYFSPVTVSSGETRSDRNNNILSFSFRILPSLNKSRELSTLTLEDILRELNEQRGYLASVRPAEGGDPYDITDSLNYVDVRSISLAYLFVESESRLVPIYVVSGIGTSESGNQTVRYYLRGA